MCLEAVNSHSHAALHSVSPAENPASQFVSDLWCQVHPSMWRISIHWKLWGWSWCTWFRTGLKLRCGNTQNHSAHVCVFEYSPAKALYLWAGSLVVQQQPSVLELDVWVVGHAWRTQVWRHVPNLPCVVSVHGVRDSTWLNQTTMPERFRHCISWNIILRTIPINKQSSRSEHLCAAKSIQIILSTNKCSFYLWLWKLSDDDRDLLLQGICVKNFVFKQIQILWRKVKDGSQQLCLFGFGVSSGTFYCFVFSTFFFFAFSYPDRSLLGSLSHRRCHALTFQTRKMAFLQQSARSVQEYPACMLVDPSLSILIDKKMCMLVPEWAFDVVSTQCTIMTKTTHRFLSWKSGSLQLFCDYKPWYSHCGFGFCPFLFCWGITWDKSRRSKGVTSSFWLRLIRRDLNRHWRLTSEPSQNDDFLLNLNNVLKDVALVADISIGHKHQGTCVPEGLIKMAIKSQEVFTHFGAHKRNIPGRTSYINQRRRIWIRFWLRFRAIRAHRRSWSRSGSETAHTSTRVDISTQNPSLSLDLPEYGAGSHCTFSRHIQMTGRCSQQWWGISTPFMNNTTDGNWNSREFQIRTTGGNWDWARKAVTRHANRTRQTCSISEPRKHIGKIFFVKTFCFKLKLSWLPRYCRGALFCQICTLQKKSFRRRKLRSEKASYCLLCLSIFFTLSSSFCSNTFSKLWTARQEAQQQVECTPRTHPPICPDPAAMCSETWNS